MSLDHKKLVLCWTEWKRFWWISVCNELFTSSSLHGCRWFTEYYVQRLCVSVKKVPKDRRDREQREQASWITKHCCNSNSKVTLRKSWRREGLGAWTMPRKVTKPKAKRLTPAVQLLLYWGKQNFYVLFRYAGWQQKYLTLPWVSPIFVFPRA